MSILIFESKKEYEDFNLRFGLGPTFLAKLVAVKNDDGSVKIMKDRKLPTGINGNTNYLFDRIRELLELKEEIEFPPSIEHTPSCGNVFEDLEPPNSDELLEKSYVVIDIRKEISKKGLNAFEAAEIIGTGNATHIADIFQGTFQDISIEDLKSHLQKLRDYSSSNQTPE